MALHSKFGWLISGPVKSKNCGHITHSKGIQGFTGIPKDIASECEIGSELQRFWEVESLGIAEDSN